MGGAHINANQFASLRPRSHRVHVALHPALHVEFNLQHYRNIHTENMYATRNARTGLIPICLCHSHRRLQRAMQRAVWVNSGAGIFPLRSEGLTPTPPRPWILPRPERHARLRVASSPRHTGVSGRRSIYMLMPPRPHGSFTPPNTGKVSESDAVKRGTQSGWIHEER